MQPLPTSLWWAFSSSLWRVLVQIAGAGIAIGLTALVFIVGTPYSGIAGIAWMSIVPLNVGIVGVVLLFVAGWAGLMATALEWPPTLRRLRLATGMAQSGTEPRGLPPVPQLSTTAVTLSGWIGMVLLIVVAWVSTLEARGSDETFAVIAVASWSLVAFSAIMLLLARVASRAWNRQLEQLAFVRPELIARVPAKKKSAAKKRRQNADGARPSRFRGAINAAAVLMLLAWPARGLLVAGNETLQRGQFVDNDFSVFAFVLLVMFAAVVVGFAVRLLIVQIAGAAHSAAASRESLSLLRDAISAEEQRTVIEAEIARRRPLQVAATLLVIAGTAAIGIGLTPLWTVPGEFPVHSEPGDLAPLAPLTQLLPVGVALFVAAWLCEAASTTRLWRRITRWQRELPGIVVPFEKIDFVGARSAGAVQMREQLERERSSDGQREPRDD